MIMSQIGPLETSLYAIPVMTLKTVFFDKFGHVMTFDGEVLPIFSYVVTLTFGLKIF